MNTNFTKEFLMKAKLVSFLQALLCFALWGGIGALLAVRG